MYPSWRFCLNWNFDDIRQKLPNWTKIVWWMLRRINIFSTNKESNVMEFWVRSFIFLYIRFIILFLNHSAWAMCRRAHYEHAERDWRGRCRRRTTQIDYRSIPIVCISFQSITQEWLSLRKAVYDSFPRFSDWATESPQCWSLWSSSCGFRIFRFCP